MKRTRLERGIYEDEKGRLWARPWANGKSTWRLLPSNTIKYGRQEFEAIRREIGREQIGLATRVKVSVTDLIEEYLAAGCPNRRLEPRPEAFVARERLKLAWIKDYFGTHAADSVRLG